MTRLAVTRPWAAQRRVTHSGLVAERLALAPAHASERVVTSGEGAAPSDFNATQVTVRAWLTALANERCQEVTKRCTAARVVIGSRPPAVDDAPRLARDVASARATAEATSRALLAVLATREPSAPLDARDGPFVDAAERPVRDSEVFALIYDYAIAYERFSRLRAMYVRAKGA